MYQVEEVLRPWIRNEQRYRVFAVVFGTSRADELTWTFGWHRIKSVDMCRRCPEAC